MNELDDKTYKDFNDFITGKVIPGLIMIADNHGYDRDNFIKYAASIMAAISEVATFKNYKLPIMESEEKNEKEIL